MVTYNGSDENLLFRCKSCALNATLEVNPANKDDMIKLGNWLLTHSAKGGDYINVKIEKDCCALCGEEYASDRIVVTTGKIVCGSCAKQIARELIGR